MSNRDSAQTVVVGAGVIGLAVARALAQAGAEVLILEANSAFGKETSSRSSEIVHSGIYYSPESLKARSCVRGRELLYEFAARCAVRVQKTGKLIVACSNAELDILEKLRSGAQANGVQELLPLTRQQIFDLEPELKVHGALFSPSSGIIDSHALMLALLADAEAHGARAVFGARVATVATTGTGFALRVEGAASVWLDCRVLVNCAGLGSVALARSIAGLDERCVPRAYFCKGSYFALRDRAPFRHLIYPVPETDALGIHLTLDLAGAARFGPDSEWIESIDYRVDPVRAEQFEHAIRRYWPALPGGALRPAYAGVRAKIAGPDEPAADFRIDAARQHGVPGLINLFGIESPGLTAALALAEDVTALIAAG